MVRESRASAVIDASVITLKKRWNGSSAGYITAPSTAAGRKGFLINNSTVNGDVSAATFYLGRPWHAGGDATLDPMTTVRDSTLSAAIRPATRVWRRALRCAFCRAWRATPYA